MEFKKEIKSASSVSPKELLIYSKPKLGKTDLVSRIEDCAIIDLENGADYISGYIHKIADPKGDILKSLANLDEILNWLIKERPYKYVAFDTLTRLEEWCEVEGTLNYMHSIQGKSFNRIDNQIVKSNPERYEKYLGAEIPYGHELFESVLTLPNGFGYRWLRESYHKWFMKMKLTADRKIFIAHIKDKFIESKSGEQILGRDIDLTGKLKSITTSFVDTIAYLNRQADGNTYLSFQAGEAVAEGSRSTHLTGQNILVGEWDKEKHNYSKTHWDKIYLD